MEIKYDYPPFQKALKAFWSVFNGRSVCAVDETGILGGCGFSQNSSVETVAFILGLRPGWASRQLYGNSAVPV